MPCSAWLKTISRPPAGIVTYHKSKVAPCNSPLDVAKCWATAQTITAAITPITTSSSMCQVCVNGRVKEPLTSHLPSQLNLPLKVVFFSTLLLCLPSLLPEVRAELNVKFAHIHMDLQAFVVPLLFMLTNATPTCGSL